MDRPRTDQTRMLRKHLGGIAFLLVNMIVVGVQYFAGRVNFSPLTRSHPVALAHRVDIEKYAEGIANLWRFDGEVPTDKINNTKFHFMATRSFDI